MTTLAILSGMLGPGGVIAQTDTAPASSDTTSKTDATLKSPAKSAPELTMPKNVPALPENALLPTLMNYTSWNNSLMTVMLLVGGKPQRCVLDTGLNACTVTEGTIASLKLTALTSTVAVTSLSESRSVPESELKNLQINTLKIDRLRAGVVDASEMYTGQAQPDAPGLWLGTPFFAAFQVTFDYEAHTILLERPDAPLPKVKGAVTLPIEVRDGRIYTRITIPKAGSSLAMIDTGAMGTLIPTTMAAKLKIVPVKTFAIRRADGRQANASLILLPTLQVGRLVQEKIPALYFEDETIKKAAANRDAARKEDTKKESSKTGVPQNSVIAGATRLTDADVAGRDEAGRQDTGPKTTGKQEAGTKSASTGAGAAGEKNAEFDHSLAVLGNDFLKRYKVTLSLSRHKMVLIPPPPPKADEDTLASLDQGKKTDKPAGSTLPSRVQPPTATPGRRSSGK